MKVCVAPGAARRFTSSLNERRRSRRERAPWRSQPSRIQSVSSDGPTRALRFGSFIASHSQSTMSSTLNSSSSCTSPSSRPPGPFSPCPCSRPGAENTSPGLALPCPGALGFLGAAQPEVIVLEHAHRHPHGAGAPVDDVAAGDDLGEVGAHRLADLLVVAQPVARAAREQLVPVRPACRLALPADPSRDLHVPL